MAAYANETSFACRSNQTCSAPRADAAPGNRDKDCAINCRALNSSSGGLSFQIRTTPDFPDITRVLPPRSVNGSGFRY